MRERRSVHRGGRRRGIAAVGAGAVAALGSRLWSMAASRPTDSMAILAACAASAVIVINAVLLQSGAHKAPFFANSPPSRQAETRRNGSAAAAAKTSAAGFRHSLSGQHIPPPVSARHTDPIGELIGSTLGSPRRVAAVQRLLSEFGYGQIKPSGILDQQTSAAIKRFEGEHRLPVTGRLSDGFLKELSTMAGSPIE